MGSQFPPVPRKPRVLIVEDEFIIADLMKDIIEECGCEVVGPFGTLPEAMQACQSTDADAAIVDLVLHGEYAYPIADVLSRRGIPFGFATGGETAAAESPWEQQPFLGKPFAVEEVRQLIGGLLRRL
jgi:DNA-binding response OmpR family regulator